VTLDGGKANLETDTSEAAWEQLGIRLTSVSASAVAGLGEDYKGGLRITEIRQGSPADRARLAAGDIIVGVMDWQTPKLESLAWIMNNPSFLQAASSKYYLIRKRSRMTVPISLESSTLSSISRNGSKDIR
jgi:S1-C subfamily serine protease